MIVAFDYHGCLDSREGLRSLALAMKREGAEVHCISAVTPGHGIYVFNKIDDLGIFKEDNIHVIPIARREIEGFHPDYSIGQDKAEVMRMYGITMMWDDNPGIVQAIRDAGFFCWHVGAD